MLLSVKNVFPLYKISVSVIRYVSMISVISTAVIAGIHYYNLPKIRGKERDKAGPRKNHFYQKEPSLARGYSLNIHKPKYSLQEENAVFVLVSSLEES